MFSRLDAIPDGVGRTDRHFTATNIALRMHDIVCRVYTVAHASAETIM